MTGPDLAPALPQSAAERQEERMAAVPEFYKTQYERLACELALLPENVEATFAQYGYSVDEAATLLESKAFLTILERVKREIHETGLSFRTKAKAISEGLLPYAYTMAQDPHTPAAVRCDLIKWTATVAGHTPKEKEESRTGGGLVLSITFAGSPPQQIVSTREPLTIEQGD